MNNVETEWILETLRRWLNDRAVALTCPVELRPEELEKRLDQNRLLPLFHTLTISWPATEAWTAFRSELSAAYQRSLMQALRQATSGVALMQGLAAVGVQSLAVRGPFLALAAYGDPAVRICADIYVLVPRGDRRRAWLCCRAMGYRSLDWECPLWPIDAHRIHWRLQRPNDTTVCELHWSVEPVYGAMTLKYPDLFNHGVNLRADGFEWRQPCPEHMLLLLCLHTFRHLADARPGGLRDGAEALDQRMLFRWLDVALFLSKYGAQVNWDSVSAHAADRRVAQSLVVGLAGVRDWLGIRLPAEAERSIPLWEDAVARQRSSEVRRRLELWWERKAGPGLGLAEGSRADVLYFLCPPARFFAPSHGGWLGLRRLAHAMSAATMLSVATLSRGLFALVTAWRRRMRRMREPLVATQPIAAGGAS